MSKKLCGTPLLPQVILISSIKPISSHFIAINRFKITRHNIATPQSYRLPESRFRDINLDIVGPLPESNGFCYLLTVIGRYTRYVTAVPMKDATTESVVYAFLRGYVSHFGVPGSVTTDRGSQFESGMWSQLLSFLGCLRKRTTSFHPQCNGLIENFHRRLKDALRLQQYPNRWYYN